MILADHQIESLCTGRDHLGWPSSDPDFQPMIAPFEPRQVRAIRPPTSDELCDRLEAVAASGQRFTTTEELERWLACEPDDPGARRVISYGLTSYGYDVRAAPEWRVFTPVGCGVIDPLAFDARCLVSMEGPECIIPPNSYALTRTIEYLRLPRDVVATCIGKSTYARCGIIVNVTPLEPGWHGHITIEVSNGTPLPVKVYAHQGIAQIQFHRGEPCRTSYADRDGKYQGQTGITPARP